MAGFFGLPQEQGPLYGAPIRRDPLVSALMGKIGQNAGQSQSGFGGFAGAINPMALMSFLSRNKGTDSGPPVTFGDAATNGMAMSPGFSSVPIISTLGLRPSGG